MKFYSLLFFILVFCLKGFTQEHKLYLTDDGKFKNDSLNASSYILLQKIDDTTYMVSQYSMKDVILTKGVYKDSTVKIPDGKFYYFREKIGPANNNLLQQNTVVYIQYTGYFKDGKKTGKWIEYSDKGNKKTISTYENDALNGEYQSIDQFTGHVIIIGNYTNSKKEGNWDIYNSNFEKPVITECYLHDKLTKTTQHFKDAHLPENFNNYLEKSLKNYIDTVKSQNVTVSFLIRENGKADSIQVKNAGNKDINAAIVIAFINAPRFQPANYDNKPVKFGCFFSFRMMAAQDEMDRATEMKNIDVISRHTNDIGRGLNRAGIGKPVE